MKSYKQYITEKPHKIGVMDDYSKPKFKEIRGLFKPSMNELTAFTMKTKWKSVRIIAGWSGAEGLYVWDANLATHPDVMKGENLDYKKYATGMLSWIDQFAKHDEKIWSLELGGSQDEAQHIGKKHRGLKDLLKNFPDTQLDGFWGA